MDDPAELDSAAVAAALRAAGGVIRRSELVRLITRRAVDRALREKTIIILRSGVYALPDTDEAIAVAHASGGVLSLTSAALKHGWAVKTVPGTPHVTLAKGRAIRKELRGRAQWHRANLGPDDVDGIATSKELTLLQCLRTLPEDEALAIADSAARAGELALLRRAAATARGPGSRQVARIASLARPEAANPFESVLRAICETVPGLRVEPQVLITSVSPWVRPDLVDEDQRIVIEADSFEWHGDRAALRSDARRYNLLVVDGWLVLRFAWEDVMLDPDCVRSVLVGIGALVRRYTERPCPGCAAA